MRIHPFKQTALLNCPRMRRSCRAFTLIEVLVVLVIIVILAATGFVMFGKMRQQAQSAVCMGNLKQIGSSLMSYSVEHNNRVMPLHVTNANGSNGGIWPVALANAGYLWEPSTPGRPLCGTGVWACPECDYTSDNQGGYGVVEGISKKSTNAPNGQLPISAITRPDRTWLVGDAMKGSDPKRGWYAVRNPTLNVAVGRHGDRVNVCMFDGHIEALTLKELKDGRFLDAAKAP